VHIDEWSRERVVLLGDAGYCASPLSGMGTSLALVGAYILAGELVASRGDHRFAFKRYHERMQSYVDQAQELPPGGVDGFAPLHRLVIALRTASMRAITKWPFRAIVAGEFTKADAIELPRYTFDLDGSGAAQSMASS
jgi:2-polyprenyl-6-methoxyphenol hydroxylase-like FAD-dependent oxidoreductase